MKGTLSDRKRLFAPVNQFSFTAPPVAVQDFPLRAAAKRKRGLRCQTIQNDKNPRCQTRGRGLQNALGRVPSRGETFDVVCNGNRTIDAGSPVVEP